MPEPVPDRAACRTHRPFHRLSHRVYGCPYPAVFYFNYSRTRTSLSIFPVLSHRLFCGMHTNTLPFWANQHTSSPRSQSVWYTSKITFLASVHTSVPFSFLEHRQPCQQSPPSVYRTRALFTVSTLSSVRSAMLLRAARLSGSPHASRAYR